MFYNKFRKWIKIINMHLKMNKYNYMHKNNKYSYKIFIKKFKNGW